MSVDKEAMRRDYEAGMTLRAIALKYGCSKTQADRIAKKEGWDRGTGTKGQRPKTPPQPIDTEKLPELEVKTEFQLVQAMTYRLLEKVADTLDNPKPIAPRDLRSISSTLLDVRQLLNALSPIEAEEQRLRIEGLRKQAEESARMQASVTVQFVDTEEAEC